VANEVGRVRDWARRAVLALLALVEEELAAEPSYGSSAAVSQLLKPCTNAPTTSMLSSVRVQHLVQLSVGHALSTGSDRA
jgi:hypothetical protein